MNICFMSNSMSIEGGPQRRFGYSVVATKVANYLQEIGHQIFYIGMQDIGSPFKQPNGIVHLGVRYDPFMSDIAPDYLRAYKADCFFTMLDIWLPQTDYMAGTCERLKIPWIPHVTLNADPLTPFIGNKLHQASWVVAPSKYNHRLLNEGGHGAKTQYIPHGVDTDVFTPNNEFDDEIKKTLGIEDKTFIGLVVNRNKGMQKRLQDAMRAWSIACINDPQFQKDSVLLMVHDPVETEGFRTDMFRDRIQMNDNIKFIWQRPNEDGVDMKIAREGDMEAICHNANISLPPEEIAKLFNLADVSVVPSQSESFCLPGLESLACGTPVIMGQHSVAQEHILDPETGIAVQPAYGEVTPLMSEVQNMNVADLAAAITHMYQNPQDRNKWSKNGIKYAQTLKWDVVLPMWKRFFEIVESTRMTTNYQHGRMGL